MRTFPAEDHGNAQAGTFRDCHGSPSDAGNTLGTNWLRKGRGPSDAASTVGTNWLAGCWRLRNDQELPLFGIGDDCNLELAGCNVPVLCKAQRRDGTALEPPRREACSRWRQSGLFKHWGAVRPHTDSHDMGLLITRWSACRELVAVVVERADQRVASILAPELPKRLPC